MIRSGEGLEDGIEFADGEPAAFLRDARLHQFAGQGSRNRTAFPADAVWSEMRAKSSPP